MSDIPVPPLPPGFKLDETPPAPHMPTPIIPALPPGYRLEPELTNPKPDPEAAPRPSAQPDMFGRTVKGVGSFLFGDPEKDPKTGKPYPEIGPELDKLGWKKAIESAGVWLVEPDDAHRAAWLAKTVPGTKVRKQRDEIIVTLNGQDFSMNNVGRSPQDFAEFMYTLPHAIGIGWASLFGKTAAKRAILAGAATAADTFMSQRASQEFGTGRTPDLRDALVSGVTAGALTWGGEKLWNKLFPKRQSIIDPKTNDFTLDVTIELRRAGIDPDTVPLDVKREMVRILNAADDPAQAVRMARAKDFKFPLSAGDATQNPKIQAREFRLERGGSPGMAMSPLEGEFQRLKGVDQPLAFGRAQSEVAKRITGQGLTVNDRGQIVTPKGEGISPAREALAKHADELWERMSASYKEADRLGGKTYSTKVMELSRALWREADPDVPEAKNIARSVAKMIGKGDGRLPAIDVAELERLRQRAVRLASDSNPRVAAAGTRLKSGFDRWAATISPDDFTGEGKAAFEKFVEGRALRSQYGAKFEDIPTIDQIIERAPIPNADGSRSFVLKRAPEEVANLVLGDRLGRDGAWRTAQAIKNILGPTSPEWRGLQREAITQLFATNSPSTLGENFRKWVRGNPQLARTLFDPDDIRLLASVGDLGRDAFYRKPGVNNYSASGLELLREGYSNLNLTQPLRVPEYTAKLMFGAGKTMGEPDMGRRAIMNPRIAPSAPPIAVPGYAGRIGQEDTEARRLLANALRLAPLP